MMLGGWGGNRAGLAESKLQPDAGFMASVTCPGPDQLRNPAFVRVWNYLYRYHFYEPQYTSVKNIML